MASPPQDTEKSYQVAQEARVACKELLRHATKFRDSANESCKSAHEMASQLDSMVVSEWIKKSPNIDIARYLRYLSTTFKAVNSVQLKMVQGMERQVVEPLENFTSYDFLEVQEVKKKVAVLGSEYEATRGKIEQTLSGKGRKGKGKAPDHQQLAEYEKDLEKLRTEQDANNLQYSKLVEELHQKKETKLLRYMFNLLELEYEYHQKAFKLLQNLRPKMDQLKEELEESENQMKGTKEGHLQQKGSSGWQKNYFVLKGGYLSCYKGKKDMQTLDQTLNIMICTTRIPPKTKEHLFEILTPDLKKPITLLAESAKDRDDWISAIQGAIEYSLNQNDAERGRKSNKAADGDEIAFKILKRIPGNDFCADCGAPDPDWASINLGILVCLECSGVHRGLGTHITKVRSATLDTKAWEPWLLLFMKQAGNLKFNQLYEHKHDPEFEKPLPTSDRATKERFIKAKYAHKIFCDLPSNPDRITLASELYAKIATTGDDDSIGVLQLIQAGADLEWQNPDDELKTVAHCAVIFDRPIYLEVILQNGGSVFSIETRQWTPMHFAAYYHRSVCANILYKHGFGSRQLELKDWQNKTAIEIALNNQAEDIVNILRGENVHTGVKIEDIYEQVEEEIMKEIIDNEVGLDNIEEEISKETNKESTPTPAPIPPIPSPIADNKPAIPFKPSSLSSSGNNPLTATPTTSDEEAPIRQNVKRGGTNPQLPIPPMLANLNRPLTRANTSTPTPSPAYSQPLPTIPLSIAQAYAQPLPSLPTVPGAGGPNTASSTPSPTSTAPNPNRLSARRPLIPPKPSFTNNNNN